MKPAQRLAAALALAGMLAAGGTHAQYASELGKLAPEALKGGEKPQPAQLHEDFLNAVKAGITEGKNRDELADTIKMQQYSHYRNFHRMRGWVYALHHLLTTGKPMVPYP